MTALALCASGLYANGITPPESVSAEEARLRVIAAAEKYKNTPYRYGGMDKRGLDCSGLVYVSFYDALGVSVPRNTWGLYSWVEKITLNEARPGDLVFFKTTGGNVSHVGILVGNGRFIHSASEGPATGVIYSSLDERYWERTFAGTGRVLPQADVNISGQTSDKIVNDINNKEKKRARKSEGSLLIGFAAAPTWNTTAVNMGVIRGAAGQARLGLDVKPFKQPMLLGMELRPEWDGALGVFRIPLTLSWGIDDKFRIFAGPVLSIGDAALTLDGESRPYAGGTSWLGAAGITFAPFSFKIAKVNLAPYGELAWQSYFYDGSKKNLGADFTAGFRFSTGLSCTWRK
ncbi:MAG: C40 family peptidase [Treponema sp.]|nr:C40 family peptidase [Treponema sp.]